MLQWSLYLLRYFARVPFPDLGSLDADTQNSLYFYGTFYWSKALLEELEEKELSPIYIAEQTQRDSLICLGRQKSQQKEGKNPEHLSPISL